MSVKDQIRHELLTDRCKETIHRWAAYLAENPSEIPDCLSLLSEDKPIPMRIAWVLDHVADNNPHCMLEHIPYMYSLKDDMDFPGYKRSLTRLMSFSGIPESIESDAIDTMFKWVLAPHIALAVKVHSIQALYHVCEKYPELSGELIEVIEDQIPKCSVGFKSRGTKLIVKLQKKIG
jgi:hypothetical protein